MASLMHCTVIRMGIMCGREVSDLLGNRRRGRIVYPLANQTSLGISDNTGSCRACQVGTREESLEEDWTGETVAVT